MSFLNILFQLTFNLFLVKQLKIKKLMVNLTKGELYFAIIEEYC